MDNSHCDYHIKCIVKKTIKRITSVDKDLQPEQHQVEGSGKEGESSQSKKKKINKQKLSKCLRNLGQEYVSFQGKTVASRGIKPRCKEEKKISKSEVSRRQKTVRYFFTKNNVRVPVCKTFFINTLDISDRIVRTALKKTSTLGLLELDKIGDGNMKPL